MEQLEGHQSKAMLGIASILMVAGTVFLVWGEAVDLLWVFFNGLVIAGLGVVCYYAAGEYRLVLEARYRSLSKTTKFVLLTLSCAPWLVMYFFISPLWDAILTAAVVAGACAIFVWWLPKLRGPKKKPSSAGGSS